MMECAAPGVEDANVWGLVSLKKGDRKAQRKILNEFHRNNKVLDKTDEIQDARRTRRVAFRGVKRQLNLWKGPVHKNRLAEQIVFPINDRQVVLSGSQEAVKLKEQLYINDIKKDPTNLQGKLYNALYRDTDTIASQEKIPDKVAKVVSKMLLEKIAMRDRERFLLARAAARNKRQNKIKSRRFHRHLKGRTMKEYEKETESLRLNNPRKFAERLLSAELNRVKERASLKHRGGSKFSKLQKLRAKYDSEARAAVADMHELSREATRRTDPDLLSDTDESDVSISSESEEESEASDFNLNDDDIDEVCGTTHTLGWWKKGSNDATGAVLSTDVAEKTLQQCEVNQMVLNEPVVCSTNVIGESDVVDPNTDGFFHALQESFANDPALQQKFNEEKSEIVKDEAPQDIDTFLPGWNSWTGPGTEQADEKRRKSRIIPAPNVKREDDKKSHVIIKRRVNQDFKQHLVKTIPFPYNTPEQFEAFISQPICREWTTELTHRDLTRPKVTVQSGRIIRPISKSATLLRDKDIERFVKQKKN
uniref:U3 small nucleolar RNA-associated protein 14 n=2 Tax=Schistosoma japonicum TaxID=6182 RepID=C1LGX0_SCHJA|nr:U3 small nucleolar RNA-associated protein 14 [Schistosoma japonicum]